ncbi:Gasdermin-A3 [Lonchura striata]|uniref:Gasdermin-A3 n=1 Tax=Lonchura striata TaxID=40157 RepID=A0A218UMC0_9PASE|nr:Gasdermin-A3 [Lonchura striata domestica]
MFKKLTKFIINEMDPYKKFDPVESIADNEHFRPLCLLRKKRKSKRIFHPTPYYEQTGFTLDDVLLPGQDGKIIESLQQDSSRFTLTKNSAVQVEGHASVPLGPASGDLQGGASSSNVFSITIEKKSVSLQSLVALRRERQINMNHSLIQQLQGTNIDLYMVTEILEASEETIYRATIMADGVFNIICHITLGAQGTRESNQGIVIPKGCTLAFKTIPLQIKDGAWDNTEIISESLHQESSQFALTKVRADQADGGLSISFDPTNVELKGGASLSKEISITPQKKSVSLESLEALRREREINMDHSFIRQLRRTNIHLYVVTEILEASEEAVYKESTKADRGFKAKFYATLCAQSNREDKQSIVIPKGCTLAFRTIPLHIRDGAWDLDYFPAESVRKMAYVADGPSTGKLGEVMTEVQYSCRIFPELSPDLLLIILNTIKAVMRDKNLLQELRQKVENLLKHDLDKGMDSFLVDSRLLFSQEEEQMLTIALVELSGVQLQQDGLAVPRDQSFEAVAALFVALYALNFLSGRLYLALPREPVCKVL